MSVEILHNLPDNGRFKLPDDKCETLHELEASFSVRLFPKGFSIGKPLEKKRVLPPIHEAMGSLYPYNHTSESFLRALDGGWIPADLLEDISCTYVNGCVSCEVLDYCANAPSSGDVSSVLSPKSSTEVMPVIYKVTLKPTTESIVKDVASMVDEKWTYKDLMEVESKILKTAWPELQLDPKTTASNTEKKSMLRSSQSIFKHVRTNKGAPLSRRWRLAASAKAMAKAGTVVNSKKIAPESGLDRYTHSNIEASVTSADGIQIAPFKPMVGSMAPTSQFPPSPRANMVGDNGWHDQPGLIEKQSSLLGKRDSRDYGPKLDTKKFKQDSPRLDVHVDNGLSRFDQKLNQEQDNKSMGSLEQTKLDMKMNADLQKLDGARIRDDKNGFGIESGRHNGESQIAAQRLMQQDISKPSWQGLSPVESTPDALLQRKRIALAQQKPDSRQFMQPYDLSTSGMSQSVSALVAGTANHPVASSSSTLLHPKDQLPASSAVSAGLSSDAMMQMQMQQTARRRVNLLQKNSANVTGIASPGSTVNSGGITNVNSPSTASMPSIAPVKIEGMMVTGQKKEPVDNFMSLISIAQRNGLPAKRRKVELPPPSDGQKPSPSWQLLLVALGNTSSDDIKDPKGQRNMADSLVGGVNVRKTRFLQFQRAIPQGSHYRRVRIRLVMCERGKDAMVEAVVQFGDDQDDETLNTVPHHVLPTMANAHAADVFAKQFCALLEKEGFELVEDQVQPTMPRGNVTTNAASAARPLPAGASALGSNLSSPRSSLINQQMSAMPLGGMQGLAPMQPSSPNALATARMLPPPGNAANRHMAANFMAQSGVNTASKALHLDGTGSQLAAVQQHQTAQHLQRAQQMVMPSQLAQLNQHSAQQLNQQMVAANPGQLQQFLQQQQRQQTQALQQRKLMGMGSLGPMGNLGIPVSGANQGGMGSMVGVNAMNNVGMPGINNVSASMGPMSNLNNVGQLQGMASMGQNTGLSNLIAHQGSLTPAQMAAFSSKARGANASARDNMTGLNASNQLHGSAGLPMMGQAMSRVGRVGLSTMARAGPVGSLGSPRLATSNMPAQGMYMNSSQSMTPQQQFSLQQLSPTQQNGPQQSINPQQLQLSQSQQANMQVQQNPSPSLNLQQPKNNSTQQSLNSPTTLLSQQQQPQQQLSSGSQQHGSVGNLGSLVGGPASPQLSSQNAGSVTSGTGMETSATNCNGPSISSG